MEKLVVVRNMKSWEFCAEEAVKDLFWFVDRFDITGMTTECGTSWKSRMSNFYWDNLNINLSGDHISNIKNIIDWCIDNKTWESDPHYYKNSNEDKLMYCRQYHSWLWSMIGAAALHYCKINGISLSKEMLISTLIKKQKDYGPKNIERFGLNGLTIRLHDKVARLENLLSKPKGVANAVSDESVYDTLLDIGGYAAIALMWIRGEFLLPMETP
jgi:hypothetical protein